MPESGTTMIEAIRISGSSQKGKESIQTTSAASDNEVATMAISGSTIVLLGGRISIRWGEIVTMRRCRKT